jgi:hypothetical protein
LPPVLLALGFYASDAIEHSLDRAEDRLQQCTLAGVDSGEVATKRPGQKTDGGREDGDLKPPDDRHDPSSMPEKGDNTRSQRSA